jgi:unspecific monooxygenase
VEVRGRADPREIAISDLPYLTSVIYESLRLLPPISQLINRRTSQDVLLGAQIYIPKGTYVGYNCYSTNRDPTVWGSTADEFRPERWGQSSAEIVQRYRQRRARAEFVSFHGGSRACLGEKFALLEARVALFVLVSRFTWELHPEWPDRKTPVSGSACLLRAFTSRLLSPQGTKADSQNLLGRSALPKSPPPRILG